MAAAKTRHSLDDLADLIVAVTEALTAALKDGEGKYPPGNWMSESRRNQVLHMHGHLLGILENHEVEMNLSHLICRAAIAWKHLAKKE